MGGDAITSILFDLDGTVINSIAGIQSAFDYAYKEIYKEDCTYNLTPFIGPSIQDIFIMLTGEKNTSLISGFVARFKERYDAVDYKKCELYAGITNLLLTLNTENNLKLFIATNKRTIPTMLILNHLQINFYFKNVYCMDSFKPPFVTKTEMVRHILINENIDANKSLLVGDTIHDKVAADNNGIKFIYAIYGFGKLDKPEYVISHSSQIINYLN